MADELQLALRIRTDVDDAARAFDGLERAMRGADYAPDPASKDISARAITPSATIAITVTRKRRSKSLTNSKPSFGARPLQSARTANGGRDFTTRTRPQRDGDSCGASLQVSWAECSGMAEETQIGIRVQAHVDDAADALSRMERELRQLDGRATNAQATAARAQDPSVRMRSARMPMPTTTPAATTPATRRPHTDPMIAPPIISSVVELSENGGGSSGGSRSSRQPPGQPSLYPKRHSRGQSRGGYSIFMSGV